MRIPIYAIQREEEAPLPGGRAILDIPLNRWKYFKPTIETSRGKPIRKIAIGIASTEESLLAMDSAKGFKDQIDTTGVIAKVEAVEEMDDFYLVTLVVESKAYFLDTQLEEGVMTVNAITVPEKFHTDDYRLAVKITAIHKRLLASANSQKALVLKAARSPAERLNAICAVLLQGEDRHKSLRVDKNERLKLIQNSLKSELAKQKTLVVKTSSTKKDRIPLKTIPKEETSSIQDLPLPPPVQSKVLKELKRLSKLPEGGSEHANVSDWLSWVEDLPWGKTSYKEVDLKALRAEFDKSHYGLDSVKDSLVEHLCVEQLRGGCAGTVLCFLGPAGTGKTSIAATLAKVAGRPLVRIALGGLYDESELRGHRRTFVGSRPGRFITGIKEAGSFTPIFLLDEVDKTSSGRADPTAALLEILDPEQNHSFVDRYLEAPVDLSKAIFICTANEHKDIPGPLRDRMEFIQFRKPTREERIVITKNYLIPEVRAAFCIVDMDISFSEGALEELYSITQLRQIDKAVRAALRYAATQIHVYGETKFEITKKDIKKQITKKKTRVGYGG